MERNYEQEIISVTRCPAKGYTVNNLGMPVWLYEKLMAKYDGRSIHYAIQQELKLHNKKETK